LWAVAEGLLEPGGSRSTWEMQHSPPLNEIYLKKNFKNEGWGCSA
jgi:hypothetical protein